MPSVIDTMRACPLFQGFTPVGLQALASIGVARNFPRGTPLFVENMVGESMFVIGLGTVRLSAKGTGSEPVQLGELGPGAYLGEVSLLREGTRLVTATAHSEVAAVEFRAADFQRLMAVKPQACVKVLMRITAAFGDKLRENREPLKSLLGRL